MSSLHTGGDDTLVEGDASPGRRDPERPLQRGESIGRYVVLDRLGSGGMGVVYAAYDPELDRKVALKLLYADLDAGSVGSKGVSEGRGRLLREAQAMARLAHPNVITVHDVGEHAGRVFMAMEFIDGQTLGEWLEEEHPYLQVLDLFSSAGAGLLAAHEKGLVHRDFKPDNVMIGADGRVRVMDFGLARPSEETTEAEPIQREERPNTDALSRELTAHGAILGTPAYMAPEQHLGGEVGPAADQFAFCVALYEGFFGKRPFSGETVAALAFAVTQGKIAPPPKGTRVPAWMFEVVSRGLAVRVDDRWPNMRALLDALHADPRARARRFGIAGAAVLGIAGAVWLGGAAGSGPAPCTDMERHLEGVWDDDRRDAVEAAMNASGAAYAEDTWQRVEQRLDAYASAWVEARTAACSATHVAGEQSELLLDRRMACLDERLEHVDGLVDVLAHADAKVMRRAVDAVAGLPRLEGCADTQALLAQLPPPEDPAVAERVRAVRATLARADANEVAGKYDEGIALARQALTEAEQTEHEPVIAEALMHLGALQLLAGDAETAEATSTRAYELAMRIRHFDVAAQTASALVRSVGYRQARHEAGRVWTVQALALARTSGDTEHLIGAETSAGLAAHDAGDFEEAEAHHRRALALKTEHRGSDDPSIANTLNNLANVAQERGDYDTATKLHTQALELWERTLGPHHPHVGSVLNNLGIDAKKQSKYDEASAYYERALANFEASLGPDHPQVAALLNNMANVEGEQQHLDEAQAYYERALDLLVKLQGPDHPNVGTLLANLGVVALDRGDAVGAEDYHRRAIAVLEKNQEADHPRLGTPLTGLGRALNNQDRHAEAIPVLERALALRESNDVGLATRAETRSALGRALVQAPPGEGGDRSRGLALVGQAIDEYREAGAGFESELADAGAWLEAHR